MKLGSLFDGIGGFPYAGQSCGFTPVWASEIEDAPISITSRHFKGMTHVGDITQLYGGYLESVDVITFGSPCQDLSIAGKRKGLKGNRSGLFTEAIRIIKEMRGKTHGEHPTFVIFENVPGAFSSNKGEDFRRVLEEIAGIAEHGVHIPRRTEKGKTKWPLAGAILGDGYSLAWRTLNAQYWGVPQRRRRIFLVADFRGHRAGEILFERKGLSWDTEESSEAREGTTENLVGSVGETGELYEWE